MPQEALSIEDLPGSKPGHRILRLNGALLLSNVFAFQATVRADTSTTLIIDFTNVPYIDSAGIGALVGGYVTRQHSGRHGRRCGPAVAVGALDGVVLAESASTFTLAIVLNACHLNGCGGRFRSLIAGLQSRPIDGLFLGVASDDTECVRNTSFESGLSDAP